MKDENGKLIKVHPYAARFPLMSDEELQELADDIKENGLKEPIVKDADGTLVDGRNRSAACKLLGIEPESIELNGDDAVAFIVSRNLKRRNLNRGQQAMLVALGVKRDASAHKASKQTGIHQTMISRARFIIEHEPKLVDEVLVGIKFLDLAYAEAKENEKKAQSDEAKLKRLIAKSPDLAELVAEGKLTLAGGIGELDIREAQQREKEKADQEARRVLSGNLSVLLTVLNPGPSTVEKWVAYVIANHDPYFLKLQAGEVTRERLQKCVAVLKEIEKKWKPPDDV
jgi:hypothetical protein